MSEIFTLLESKYKLYNQLSFIETDPISIPHQYKRKNDIEIAGFLTALISWGNRKAILKSSNHLMELLENSPFDFITGASPVEFKRLERFIYRTFNGDDLLFMIYALRRIYLEKNTCFCADVPAGCSFG